MVVFARRARAYPTSLPCEVNELHPQIVNELVNAKMKTGQFIQLLQQEDSNKSISEVLQTKGLYDIVKHAVGAKTRDANKKTNRASRTLMKANPQPIWPLMPSIEEWTTSPEKFFEGRTVEAQDESSQSTRRIDEHVTTTDNLPVQPSVSTIFKQKAAQMRKIESEKLEKSIRFVFSALYFYDLFVLYYPREVRSFLKAPTILSYAKEILSTLDSAELGKDFVRWVKLGQMYHFIGDTIGSGSWFIYADSLASESLIANLPRRLPNLKNTLQPLKEKVSVITNIAEAENAANAIRKYQTPHELFVSSESHGPKRKGSFTFGQSKRIRTGAPQGKSVNLTPMDSHIVSHVNPPTLTTSVWPHNYHERGAMDASGCMPVLGNQPLSQAWYETAVNRDEVSLLNVAMTHDIWAAPRITGCYATPIWTHNYPRVLYPSAAACVDTFDAAPRTF